MKITRKISITIIFLLFLSAVSSGIFYFYIFKKNLEDRTKAQLVNMSALKKYFITYFMQERIDVLGRIASEKAFFDHLVKFRPTNDEKAWSLQSGIVRSVLQERLGNQEDFLELFFTGSNGQVFFSTDKNNERKFRNNTEYFKEAKNRQVYMNLYYDTDQNQPVLIISHAVFSEEESFLGLLSGSLNLNMFAQVLYEQAGLGETGETYLVNKFNLLISNSRFPKDAAFKTIVRTPGTTECQSGKAGFHQENYLKHHVLGYHEWLPGLESCLVAEIGQDEILSGLSSLKIMLFIINVLILCSVFFISLFLFKVLTLPLKRLEESANAISRGNFDFDLEIKTKDEVGRLSQAFHKMITELKKSRNDLVEANQALEQTVEKRTEELRQRNDDLEKINRFMIGRELEMVKLKKKVKDLQDGKIL